MIDRLKAIRLTSQWLARYRSGPQRPFYSRHVIFHRLTLSSPFANESHDGVIEHIGILELWKVVHRRHDDRFWHLSRNRCRFLARNSTGRMPIGSVLRGPHRGMRWQRQRPSQPEADRSAREAAEAVTDTAAKPAGLRQRVS